MTAVNANEFNLPPTATYTVKTIVDNAATPTVDESLGCSVGAFGGPLPPNTMAVVNRGVCARVAKAIFGQQAGAAAVVMVNNSTDLPPVEGPITSNPDDGVPFASRSRSWASVACRRRRRSTAADCGRPTASPRR